MVTAIVLIGITAMTITEIGLTVAVEVRRTTCVAEDAQLRELLLAGGEFAMQHRAAGHYEVSLPDQIAGKLSVDVHNDRTIYVEAALPRRRQSERLILADENGRWLTTQANLQPLVNP
jgi:hypothetical protein